MRIEQAANIKAVALRVRAKYFVAPSSEGQAWEQRRAAIERASAEAGGLPPQQLPATMPSLEFKRVRCPYIWQAIAKEVDAYERPDLTDNMGNT